MIYLSKSMDAPEIPADAQWREIVGWSNYMVSNTGLVKQICDSPRRKAGIIPIHNSGPKGYLQVQLNQNGASTHFRLHKIVALAFIPNPENKPYINHKDCNKHNNHVDNLEWCTHKENTDHAVKNNRYTNDRYNKTGISKGDAIKMIIDGATINDLMKIAGYTKRGAQKIKYGFKNPIE